MRCGRARQEFACCSRKTAAYFTAHSSGARPELAAPDMLKFFIHYAITTTKKKMQAMMTPVEAPALLEVTLTFFVNGAI